MADAPLDLSSEPDGAALIQVTAAAQNEAAQQGFDELLELSLAFYDDLQDLRRAVSAPHDHHAIDFLQFWLSLSPLATGVGRREFSPARDWAIRALVDDAQPEQAGETIHLWRLPELSSVANPAFRAQVPDTILEWAANVCYLARATGDLPELAGAAVGTALPLAVRVLAAPEADGALRGSALDAALHIAEWLNPRNRDAAGPLVDALDRFEDDDRNLPEARKRVAIALVGPLGEGTSMEPAARAARGLDRYGDLLEGHERLALLVGTAVSRPDVAVERLDDVLAAVQEHNAHLERSMRGDPVGLRYARTRMFQIVAGLVRTLAAAGHGGTALQLLCAWQDAPAPLDEAILMMAADPLGTLWVRDAQVLPTTAEPDNTTWSAMLDAANRALGLAITDRDALDQVLEAPERGLGMPVRRHAREFHEAAVAHLRLESMDALLEPEPDARPVIVPMPSVPVPVQALAIREVGRAAPLSASLSQPQPDRAVRRIVVWPSVTGADWEADAIRVAFDGTDAIVEVLDGTMTAERFIEAYEAATTDVLWIASHGERAPYRPHESRLVLGEGVELSLRDLLGLRVPDAGRRLLVLNSCDSGETATYGGLGEFGLGAAIAGPNQAVVAHLWPVGIREAASFGALVAVALAEGHSFYAAYEVAARVLGDGRERVLELLDRDLTGAAELRDRLRSANGPPEDNLLDWGSPVFLQ